MQMLEMGKCRLCQRPTQEIKDLIRSDTSLLGRPWKGNNILARPILASHASRACLSLPALRTPATQASLILTKDKL